jgi:hypothetical protein
MGVHVEMSYTCVYIWFYMYLGWRACVIMRLVRQGIDRPVGLSM